jgi:hypothetical protein
VKDACVVIDLPCAFSGLSRAALAVLDCYYGRLQVGEHERHASLFRLLVEARRAKATPAVEHDRPPHLLGLTVKLIGCASLQPSQWQYACAPL